MRKKRLLWQLFPSYLLITLVSLLVATLYVSGELRSFYYDQAATDLKSRAWLLEERFAAEGVSGHTDRIDQLCNRLGEASATRITVVLPDGKVVGDSEESPAKMDNHADRPEIIDAMAGRSRPSVRFSHTLGKDMMYVAIPVRRGDRTIGILRTSVPVTSIDRALGAIRLRMVAGGLMVALLAAGVSLFISRRITRPLERLKRGAEEFSRGDFSHKLPAGNSLEIAAVMLAVGRVIGETMAVMMVTGNAAIITASPLESVRTMTATIAAEMGEVPFGSDHYRALFCVGIVLLLATFTLNMVAQGVLKKYRIG